MQSLERRFESISVKAVVITILTMLMLWPLSRVETLISERQNLQHALATFYLLLLALSEHIGFAASYALAAGALVALISTYISGATNNRRAAAGIGAALAASYGLLYAILLSQPP